ncbi:ARI3B protein, partial [Semnornis frantzii]|nr:ARI3B protein [Semnornis frantzii]
SSMNWTATQSGKSSWMTSSSSCRRGVSEHFCELSRGKWGGGMLLPLAFFPFEVERTAPALELADQLEEQWKSGKNDSGVVGATDQAECNPLYHRVPAWWGLEGTSGAYPVQPLLLQQLAQHHKVQVGLEALQRRRLSTSLGNLLQASHQTSFSSSSGGTSWVPVCAHCPFFLPCCFLAGTPINRIPIMAKQILDLYMLYKLVTEKGGLVEIINKKIWREITKGLNLPTSITSAAFTLRTQYMKYLYAYECEKKSLSSPAELQAAIDGNRREGRRPSYSSSLFSYSPTTTGPPSLLSPPKIRFPIIGVAPGSGTSNPRVSPAAAAVRKGDSVPLTVSMPNRIAVPVTLASQQASVAARTATLEQLRERLESGEPPEKKVSRMTEEEQRLVQQALQRNLFSMARQIPMKIKINGKDDKAESAAALNVSPNGIGSINMSVEINGTIYAGEK